ncbi:hypothetical protein EBF04_16350 [Streptomyces sp. I6]|nr:hypothetical protein EBF04_16350 [Streptomyces sp. I6]
MPPARWQPPPTPTPTPTPMPTPPPTPPPTPVGRVRPGRRPARAAVRADPSRAGRRTVDPMRSGRLRRAELHRLLP